MTYPPQPPPSNGWGDQSIGPQSGYPDQGWGQQPDPYGYNTGAPNSGYGQSSSPPMGGVPESGPPWQQQQYMQPTPQPPAAPPPPPQSKTPVWLFVVAGVVLLSVVAAAGFFLFNLSGGTGDQPQASPSSESSDPDSSVSNTASDSPDFITDTSTGLTYQALGRPWQPTDGLQLVAGAGPTYGEQYKVEDQWIAQFAIGEIDGEQLGYESLDSIEDSLITLADKVDKSNYHYDGEPLDGMKRAEEPEFTELQIAGWEGMSAVYLLEWDDSDLEETGEVVFLGLLDDGAGTLAGFQVSIPVSVYYEVEEPVKDALNSLKFK